ncbi:alpha/beta fold hydrolase [Planosporangium mesophilum]|uniref:Alpha/beta hydrolase n=1 Tax=Planosporangium mesophilum TaxID=689768 RepID=A0A8J3TEV1_9ACTN|nr:alpha/beta hydrolase [Planosporangium mesophilum]NJC84771.1 alpha/beta hydrolase [Planosporangium mesophilum]GII24211.1 alpha/beta hydrolase [Planosporangium mesophilum]
MARAKTARRAGIFGAIVGVAAAGIAAGVAAERALVRRTQRQEDPFADEPFGKLPHDDELTVVTPDGIDLHVELLKSETGPDDLTVIFVHGFCLDMGTFHFQRRGFEGRYRMVFYDQPGHGRSGRLKDGEYTLEALAAGLASVIEVTAPTGRIVLVGHSMGGMTIMALAEQAPRLFAERVAGVVLISTSAGNLDQVTFGLPEVVARFRHPLMPLVRNAGKITVAMVDRARRAGTDLAWLLTRRYGFGTQRPSPALVSYVETMNSATSAEVIARYLRTLYTHARLLALAALREVPVLVVCGDVDVLTPLAHSQEICKALPDAEMVVVSNGGHVVLLEHADEVNAAIGSFLQRVA